MRFISLMITWLEGQRERSLDDISVEETLRYSGPWLLPNRDRSYTLKDLSSFRHISFIYHEKMGWNWSKYNFKWCFRWGPSAVSHLCSAVLFLHFTYKNLSMTRTTNALSIKTPHLDHLPMNTPKILLFNLVRHFQYPVLTQHYHDDQPSL